MKALNKSDFTQNVLMSTIGPTVTAAIAVAIPDSSIDVMEAFVGQTEPPLAVTLVESVDLTFTDADYNYFVKVVHTASGVVKVNDQPAAFSTDANGDPVLTYEWATGDLDTAGLHDYMFWASEISSGKPYLFTPLRLRVRAVV